METRSCVLHLQKFGYRGQRISRSVLQTMVAKVSKKFSTGFNNFQLPIVTEAAFGHEDKGTQRRGKIPLPRHPSNLMAKDIVWEK